MTEFDWGGPTVRRMLVGAQLRRLRTESDTPVLILSAHLDGWSHVFEAQYRIQDAAGEWSWRVDRGHVTERGPYGTPLQMLGVSGDVS